MSPKKKKVGESFDHEVMGMTDEEVALYQEQEKITEALRRFSGPFPADNPPTFTTEELEYADRLRQRYQEIQRQLEQMQRGNSKF